jgi:hypothetical protein
MNNIHPDFTNFTRRYGLRLEFSCPGCIYVFSPNLRYLTRIPEKDAIDGVPESIEQKILCRLIEVEM